MTPQQHANNIGAKIYPPKFLDYLSKILKEKGWEGFREANKKRLEEAKKRGII